MAGHANPPSDVEHRAPLPIFTHFILPQFIVCVVIALHPSFTIRLATWVSIAAVLLSAVRYDTGAIFQNYSMGTAFAALSLNALVLLLSDPMTECRHEAQKAAMVDMPLWQRIYNAECITVNTRGIGWNYQIPHLPLPPASTRCRFILHQTLRLARFLLLLDLVQTYIDLNSAIVFPSGSLSIWHPGLGRRALFVWAYATKSLCAVTIPYDTASIIAIALGLSPPKAWPLAFGAWKDAYTLRRFWGRVWQQQMRRFVTAIGKYLACTLRCTPGSWASSHVQLFTAFVVSGLAHVPGDTMIHPRFTGASFAFFPAQAVAITLEDFVVDVARKVGVREGTWTRVLGYVWTAAWLTYSVAWFADNAARSGMAQDHLPFQPHVVRPLMGTIGNATGIDLVRWMAA